MRGKEPSVSAGPCATQGRSHGADSKRQTPSSAPVFRVLAALWNLAVEDERRYIRHALVEMGSLYLVTQLGLRRNDRHSALTGATGHRLPRFSRRPHHYGGRRRARSEIELPPARWQRSRDRAISAAGDSRCFQVRVPIIYQRENVAWKRQRHTPHVNPGRMLPTSREATVSSLIAGAESRVLSGASVLGNGLRAMEVALRSITKARRYGGRLALMRADFSPTDITGSEDRATPVQVECFCAERQPVETKTLRRWQLCASSAHRVLLSYRAIAGEGEPHQGKWASACRRPPVHINSIKRDAS